MRFDVEFLPDAIDELALAWMYAPDRDAVSRACAQIERDLAIDPANLGESRPHGRRIYFVAPLGVIFRVHPNERKVVVVHLWRFR